MWGAAHPPRYFKHGAGAFVPGVLGRPFADRRPGAGAGPPIAHDPDTF